MKLDRFYSAPRGATVTAEDVCTAIMDRSVCLDDYYDRLVNLFPVFSNRMSPRLLHQLTARQFTFERDCGTGETTAMNRSITRDFDTYNTDMPPHVVSTVQGVRLRTAGLFGAANGVPDIELFASQRSLWATPGISIASMPHIDNKLVDTREFGLAGILGNGVNKRRCRTYGIDPQDFGMIIFDHRSIAREDYDEMADEFFGNSRSLGKESSARLEALGGWRLPVNHWSIVPDCLFHSGRYLSAEAKAKLPQDADIGFVAAYNIELRNRATVLDPHTGRLRGADAGALCITN